MLQNLIRRFDDSDEHIKELRSDLASIGQKVNAHVVSIKYIEFQMDQLASTVNPCQTGIIRSNTVENLKNDVHCITTPDGQQTIDPAMLFGVENMIRGDDEVVNVSGELGDKTGTIKCDPHCYKHHLHFHRG